MMKELEFIGTYGYVWTTWQRSLKLLGEGKIDTEALISHEFLLEQFDEAFRVTQDGTGLKVIFNPQNKTGGPKEGQFFPSSTR